jgi:hypothetical protein
VEIAISLESVVVASPDQVSCDLEGEAAILNLKSGVYYGLDPVGARIWGLTANPIAVSAIRDALLSEYEVDPDRCVQDLLALLNELAAQGLIQVTEGGEERHP